MSWKLILVAVLFLTISLSPRISLGVLSSGRSIDIRYEDIVVILIAVLWFMNLALQTRKEFHVSPLFRPILIYLFLAALSTCVGIIIGWVSARMAFFYYFKEIEYFLIFLIVANFITSYHDFRIAVYSLLICALVNGAYSLYQLLPGRAMVGFYGVSSLGESASFPTGGYLAIMFLLSVAVFLVTSHRIMKLLSMLSIAMCGFGLISSGSRASVFGVVVSFAVLLFLISKRGFGPDRIRLVSGVFILLAIFLALNHSLNYFDKAGGLIARLTNVQNMKASLFEGRFSLYIRLLNTTLKSPLIGLGKTALGSGEAHNHYLRVLLEMGLLGLGAFVYMLISIIRLCFGLASGYKCDLTRAVGLGCLLATLCLMAAATVQDAFLTVKINGAFWGIVGLASSAYSHQVESTHNDLLPQEIG